LPDPPPPEVSPEPEACKPGGCHGPGGAAGGTCPGGAAGGTCPGGAAGGGAAGGTCPGGAAGGGTGGGTWLWVIIFSSWNQVIFAR